MKIVSNNIEASLVEVVKSVKGEIGGHYSIHFHLSRLQEHYKSEFQLRIAVNILNDIFREDEGYLFVAGDGDIFVIYYGDDRTRIDKAIFQLRYLFLDDPLANNADGSENEEFSDVYDLAFQWRLFYKICNARMGETARIEIKTSKDEGGGNLITPTRLVNIIEGLEEIDLNVAIRKQPICALKSRGAITPVFHEMYVNIGHLQKMLKKNYSLASNKWLFNHLTEVLDIHVIDILYDRPKVYLGKPISLNLNIDTILSPLFDKLCKHMESMVRTKIVIEIGIADVFSNMHNYNKAREIIHGFGHRLCLDGLTNESFVQIDRASLGFDLAKLQWNADFAGDLNRPENLRLAESVKKCGSNRMILCRCDSKYAIDYGKALGISLYQGRYPDMVLDPDAAIIN